MAKTLMVCLRLASNFIIIEKPTTVSLGPFDGNVAGIVNNYVMMTPNHSQIFLLPLQRREVFLCADFCYSPDDPTL